jgi:hypothetical protein
MPTTKEFGPKRAYGDWEYHENLATRFGFSSTRSPEQRFTNATGGADNTSLRLADSLNVFEAGALAPGITVDTVDYKILSLDAGMKYKGIFLQTEIYNRWLDKFKADGALPVAASTTRGSTCRARSPRFRRSSSRTARPRRSTATRPPASATAPNTWPG